MERNRETHGEAVVVPRTRETYDALCAEADALLAKYSPCAGCRGCSRHEERAWDCCDGCPFLGPQGCTTQCLACKLWLCSTPNNDDHNRPRELRVALIDLQHRAWELNFHYARATPEEVLALYPGEHRGKWWFYNNLGRAPRHRVIPITIKK